VTDERIAPVRWGILGAANIALKKVIPGMRKISNVEANTSTSERGPLPAPLHAELRKHRWDRTPTEWSQ